MVYFSIKLLFLRKKSSRSINMIFLVVFRAVFMDYFSLKIPGKFADFFAQNRPISSFLYRQNVVYSVENRVFSQKTSTLFRISKFPLVKFLAWVKKPLVKERFSGGEVVNTRQKF